MYFICVASYVFVFGYIINIKPQAQPFCCELAQKKRDKHHASLVGGVPKRLFALGSPWRSETRHFVFEYGLTRAEPA
jgi:hypothetical protein